MDVNCKCCADREAYPELTVYDIQFAYDITKLVHLDQARYTSNMLIVVLTLLFILDLWPDSSFS